MSDELTYVLAALATPLMCIAIWKYKWLTMVGLWLVPILKAFIATRVPIFMTVDLTVVVLAAIGFMCLVRYKNISRFKDPHVRSFLIFHGLLVLIMALSYTWTNAPSYGFTKTAKFAVFSLISFVAPIMILQDRKEFIQFLYGLIFVAVMVALIIIFSPSFQQVADGPESFRISAFESNPLNPSFLIAVAASVCFLLPRKYALLTRALYGGVFLLFEYAIFLTGSRSMFAQAFLALGIWALLTKSDFRWIFRALIILLMLGIPLFVISDPSLKGNRVAETLANPVEKFQQSGRHQLWNYCLKNSWDKPIAGHGVGSFATEFFHRDAKLFPHNLFLEALFELGIIGLVCLIAMFWIVATAFFKFKSKRGIDQNEKDLGVLWFSAVVAAAFSISLHWDIADNRLLWNMFGCMLCIPLLDFGPKRSEKQRLVIMQRAPDAAFLDHPSQR